MPLILERIKGEGLVILEQKFITATEDQCRQHYNIKTRNYGATEEQIVSYLAKSWLMDHVVKEDLKMKGFMNDS